MLASTPMHNILFIMNSVLQFLAFFFLAEAIEKSIDQKSVSI